MRRRSKAGSVFTDGRAEGRSPSAGDLAYRAQPGPWSLGLATLALLAAAMLAFAGIGASSASAASKVPATPPTFGASGSQGGQLAQARGVAVNETGNGGVPAGTVYVAEFGNHRISSFSAGGTFIRAWGWDVIVNTGDPANSNGTEFEICDTTTDPPNALSDCKAGIAGSVGGQLNHGGQFNGIAGGIAVSQSTGVVSVFDRGNNRVQQFSATGTFLRAFGRDTIVPGGPGEVIDEINERQEVVLWAGLGGKPTGGTFTLAFETQVTEPIAHDATAVTVQGALEGLSNLEVGDIVVTGTAGSPWVVEFTGNRAGQDVSPISGNADLLEPPPPPPGSSIEVTERRKGGPVPGFEICEDAPSCKAGASSSRAGGFTTNGTALTGIAADGSGNVYVSDPSNARVQKFGPGGGFLAAAGWDVVDGVNNPGAPGDDTTPPINQYEVCTVAATCKAGVGGTNDTQFGSSNLPSFIAASPAGDVYVVSKANGTIYRLTAGLAFGEEYAATTSSSTNPNRNAVAVNPDDGNVFFGVQATLDGAPTSNIYELDPVSGTIVETHTVANNEWVGLAVNGETGRMYGTRTAAAGANSAVVHMFDDEAGVEHTLEVTVDGDGDGTVISDPEGINCDKASSPCSEDFVEGPVTLQAAAADGSTFAGWTGPDAGSCDTDPECVVEMDDAKEITATFEIAPDPEYTLDVTVTGNGTVDEDPAGQIVDCRTNTGTCQGLYEENAVITLVQEADTDHEFVGWGGACSGSGACEVTMDDDKSVTATFVAEGAATLTVVKGGYFEGGTVISTDPVGIDCGTDCEVQSAGFPEGDPVSLQATAADGYVFAGWLGCKHTGPGTCQVTLSSPETEITAMFIKDGTGATITPEPPGANCPNGGVKVESDSGTEYICNGEDGEDGQDGQDGSDGQDGADGNDGNDGADGSDGAPGSDGNDGAPGPAGVPGLPGLDGPRGAAGAEGPMGPLGERGARGKRGPPGRVTCRVRQRGKRVQVICRVRGQNQRNRRISWRLMRGGKAKAKGAATATRKGNARIRLNAAKLRQGRYVLRVVGQGGGARLVIR